MLPNHNHFDLSINEEKACRLYASNPYDFFFFENYSHLGIVNWDRYAKDHFSSYLKERYPRKVNA